MCTSHSQPTSISNELEIPATWPRQELKRNGQWSETLAKKSWDARTSEEQLEVWTFRPDTQVGLAGQPVNEILLQIFPSLTNRNRKATTQALQCIILAAAQAIRAPIPVNRIHGFLQGTDTAQSKQITRYKTSAFSNTVLAKVLNALASSDHLKVHRGFKGKGYAKGVTTLWIPTDRFNHWLQESYQSLNIIVFMEDVEPIRLRDDKKSPMDYSDTPDTNAMRERMMRSNKLRAGHRWTYHQLEDDFQFYEGITQVQLHSVDLNCRRIFKGNFQRGGRFYCGAQTLRKAERCTLCIDGEPTVELDFKSMQPRMIYHRKGMEAPADCYTSDTMDRETAKSVSLICLNTENRISAERAVRSKLGVTSALANEYIDSFTEQHSQISDWFFSSAWGQLQYLESQITDMVLERAMQQDIPVLPIHDSYITKTRHVFKMRDILVDTYRKHLDFDPELDWE